MVNIVENKVQWTRDHVLIHEREKGKVSVLNYILRFIDTKAFFDRTGFWYWGFPSRLPQSITVATLTHRDMIDSRYYDGSVES